MDITRHVESKKSTLGRSGAHYDETVSRTWTTSNGLPASIDAAIERGGNMGQFHFCGLIRLRGFKAAEVRFFAGGQILVESGFMPESEVATLRAMIPDMAAALAAKFYAWWTT